MQRKKIIQNQIHEQKEISPTKRQKFPSGNARLNKLFIVHFLFVLYYDFVKIKQKSSQKSKSQKLLHKRLNLKIKLRFTDSSTWESDLFLKLDCLIC